MKTKILIASLLLCAFALIAMARPRLGKNNLAPAPTLITPDKINYLNNNSTDWQPSTNGWFAGATDETFTFINKGTNAIDIYKVFDNAPMQFWQSVPPPTGDATSVSDTVDAYLDIVGNAVQPDSNGVPQTYTVRAIRE